MAHRCVVLLVTLVVSGYVTVAAQPRPSAPRIEPVLATGEVVLYIGERFTHHRTRANDHPRNTT